jgi:hypothetical protein
MLDILTLTFVHTALSFIALGFGIVAVYALFSPLPAFWTETFLVTAVLTTLTGFVFPITAFTPALGTGIITTLILIAMSIGRFAFRFQGRWKSNYIAGMVANLYFLAFVAIVQAFLKVPALTNIAPTQEHPVFIGIQAITLVLFIIIGIKATARPSFIHNAVAANI